VANSSTKQYVDIEVTKNKFNNEINEFTALEKNYNERGVFLVEIQGFTLRLLFTAPQIKPSPVLFSVELDYSNWDFEPPALRVINPFTKAVLRNNEVGVQFLQWNNEAQDAQSLLVGHDIPFLCIPGIREYHQHFHHSGDSWMLYRTRGEGKLTDIIEKIIKHATLPLVGYLVNVNGHSIVFHKFPLVSDKTKAP
jgi:putative metal binding uncharacterized protein